MRMIDCVEMQGCGLGGGVFYRPSSKLFDKATKPVLKLGMVC